MQIKILRKLLNDENKRIAKLFLIAVLVFSPIYFFILPTPEEGGERIYQIFSPNVKALKKITIQLTDLNTKRIVITLNEKEEFKEFSKIISAALEKGIRPKQSKYLGKDIITYTYDSHEIKFMITVNQNREVYIMVYSSATDGLFYGWYRFDGLMDFIYKIESKRGQPIHYGKDSVEYSIPPSP